MGTRGATRHARLGGGIAARKWLIVGVSLVTTAAATSAAPDASAHHTAVPSSVALVGSLQSELGCPGDWQPECPTTELLPVEGRTGVFQATFDVPAGTFEYKVALNDSWAENYGAGGLRDGANISLVAPGGPITFVYDHATHVIRDGIARPLGADRGAHWLRRDLIAWDLPTQAERGGFTYRLFHAPNGELALDNGQVVGGSSLRLRVDEAGMPEDVKATVPHLAAYEVLRFASPPQDQPPVDTLLTGQLVVASFDRGGALVEVTGLQLPGVLDDVYAGAAARDLGVTWSAGTPHLALWAPTATHVDLLLRPVGATADQRVAMHRDGDGVWSATGDPTWKGATYAFAVDVYVPATGRVESNVVTDPYSVALTVDSQRSVVADLDDPALAPPEWSTLAKPPATQRPRGLVYELHVRDFSIDDRTVPAAHRGTFLAFTHASSAGMSHLRSLADAGATYVQLMPAFDFAGVPERRADQLVPRCNLASLPPDSDQQQVCVAAVRARDGFNWGYSPWHYSTPEGSYAVDQSGAGRTKEFRAMVAALNGAGLRVSMDVVYNHTSESGQNPASVLDRIVPGYYHRLDRVGNVETSTCCPNTATEHRMTEKLMVDSVVMWARDYKVDAFRFDVMGHHSKANMLRVRAALDALTLTEDGVDGKAIYLYGEGWNFGEVADDARFVQARQGNLAGTGIGTFNDRVYHPTRGPGPFRDDARARRQGFGSGLYTDPNGDAANGTPDQQRARLLAFQDLVKLGLAGNLSDYSFVDRTGTTIRGDQFDLGGEPAGYAGSPSETITYVDVHDGETLFDILQYKLPAATPMSDRVRMNTLSLAIAVFAQGVALWHGGTDLLRSKSLDINSYDSGDWFNRVDWSKKQTTWGSGLPPAPDNQPLWPVMRPLLADRSLRPGSQHIAAAADRAAELLRIADSSPLFDLATAGDVQARVGFPQGGPDQPLGVIVMTLDDSAGVDLDPHWERIVVVFNASPHQSTQTLPAQAGRSFTLHPVQASGGDRVVRAAALEPATGSFTVPARTVAVFVSPT
jgi:pullulanase-type alpha-1,6-glucosidase